MNLECRAKGIPLPFISWQLNKEAVLAPSNDIYQKYQSGQFGQYSIPMKHGVGILTLDHNNEISLKITYSKYVRKNAGKYECSVISFSGRDERFVDIGVHCKYLRIYSLKINIFSINDFLLQQILY